MALKVFVRKIHSWGVFNLFKVKAFFHLFNQFNELLWIYISSIHMGINSILPLKIMIYFSLSLSLLGGTPLFYLHSASSSLLSLLADVVPLHWASTWCPISESISSTFLECFPLHLHIFFRVFHDLFQLKFPLFLSF